MPDAKDEAGPVLRGESAPLPAAWRFARNAAAAMVVVLFALVVGAVVDAGEAKEARVGTAGTPHAAPVIVGGGPLYGKAKEGLQLGLTVHCERKHGRDLRSYVAEIRNVSAMPITLVGAIEGRDDVTTYVDYAMLAISMHSEPPWPVYSAQTMGGLDRTLPQPTETLPPGGAFRIEWRTTGRNLLPRKCINNYPLLCDDGLYHVRALLTVRTGAGKNVRLLSGRVPISVGESLAKPKLGVAWVSAADAKSDKVWFRVGTDSSVAPGDIFSARLSDYGGGWTMEVLSVDRAVAECRIKERIGNPASENSWERPPPPGKLPDIGDEVSYSAPLSVCDAARQAEGD